MAGKELEKLLRELEEENSCETMRTAYMDPCDFYDDCSKLQQARSECIESRDHFVQPHNRHICLRSILVSFEAGAFPNVENYHHMAENAIPENGAAARSGDLGWFVLLLA